MSECRVVDLMELGVSKEVFDKIYSMGEQDGRSDMIDEVIKIVEIYDDKGMSLCDVERITDGILKELEQLKEKTE